MLRSKGNARGKAATGTPAADGDDVGAGSGASTDNRGTCHKLQMRLGLSTNQTLKMATIIRTELGQSAVQSFSQK